jgi:hypothetical protein
LTQFSIPGDYRSRNRIPARVGSPKCGFGCGFVWGIRFLAIRLSLPAVSPQNKIGRKPHLYAERSQASRLESSPPKAFQKFTPENPAQSSRGVDHGKSETASSLP